MLSSSQKWVPTKYMLRGVKFLLDKPGAGLWLDPGLRKTSIVLAALTALKQEKNLKRALVIAPLRVAQLTWPGELRKWTDFHHLKFNVLHGGDKDDLLTDRVDVSLINPEGLAWLFAKVNPEKWPWDVLVVDESTKFKSWKAQRTKLLCRYLDKFDRRWILTGTPAPNGLGDVFAQVYIMDGGKALGPHITKFRNRYMVQGGYLGYQWLPRPGAWEEVARKIKPIVMRLDAKDWIELPPLVYNTIEVELPDAARQVYKKLERDFFVELEKGDVVAVNAAALSTKLRQATNGSVYMADGAAHVLHDAKLDALDDLVEELQGSPLLVSVSFLSEVAQIRARLGATIPYLGGGVSGKVAEHIVHNWNAGKLPVLLVHPASVSHGLNMQENAHHLCWYGLTWNLEEYDQLIRRIWRSGQKQRVIVHHIIARKTVDQAVVAALQDKSRNQSALLARLKEYRKAETRD
jgi:SNF2 family DNA or RNA helicase